MEISEEIEEERLQVCRRFVDKNRERIASLLEDGHGVRGAEKIEALERHYAMLQALAERDLATAAEEHKLEKVGELVKAARLEHQPLEMEILYAEMEQVERDLEGIVGMGKKGDDVKEGMTTDSPRQTYEA